MEQFCSKKEQPPTQSNLSGRSPLFTAYKEGIGHEDIAQMLLEKETTSLPDQNNSQAAQGETKQVTRTYHNTNLNTSSKQHQDPQGTPTQKQIAHQNLVPHQEKSGPKPERLTVNRAKKTSKTKYPQAQQSTLKRQDHAPKPNAN